MLHSRPIWFALVLVTLVLLNTAAAQDDDLRIIEFETTEVTAPHVVVSPDGEFLILTLLGKLFRLSSEGGEAMQLTFGPYFDTDPVISPDGSLLAFTSDRDGSEGNIFLLNLSSGEVRQVTHELSAARPAWTKDGEGLVYLSFTRQARDSPQPWKVGESPTPTTPAVIRRLVVHGEGDVEAVTVDPQLIRAVFFLPDGRLAWTVIEPKSDDWISNPEATTRVVVMDEGGTLSTLRTIAGYPDCFAASPTGDGLYYRRSHVFWDSWVPASEDLVFVPVQEGPEIFIAPLSRRRGWARRFAPAPENGDIYLGEAGRIWKIDVSSGAWEPIPFRAKVSLQVRDPVPPLKQSFSPAETPVPDPVLLQRVRVLDFRAGGFGLETSLLIQEGRILRIGPEPRPLPSETTIVDTQGRFAIPGLFDLHIHGGDPEAFLSYGVTSVRSLGWGWEESASAPRSFSTEPNLGAQYIGSEQDARSYVRLWKDRAAQLIKIYNTISRPLQRAAAEEARRLRLPVAGHGTTVQEITQNVILGYSFLEHAAGPSRVYKDVLTMLAMSGTRWDPTLAVRGGQALLLRDAPGRRKEVPASVPLVPPFLRQLDTQLLRGYWADQLAAVRDAHRLGVKLHAGTDQGAGFLHWELEYFVQAGLSPLEVLSIATQEAAEAVGAENELGTLDPGKLADLVLLDANPLEDIKNTQTIWRVIKGGWMFDPEAMRPDRN